MLIVLTALLSMLSGFADAQADAWEPFLSDDT
jgi:hypothetical protein